MLLSASISWNDINFRWQQISSFVTHLESKHTTQKRETRDSIDSSKISGMRGEISGGTSSWPRLPTPVSKQMYAYLLNQCWLKLKWNSGEVEWMDAEDPLFMLYTSGSTGTPKGVQVKALYEIHTFVARCVMHFQQTQFRFSTLLQAICSMLQLLLSTPSISTTRMFIGARQISVCFILFILLTKIFRKAKVFNEVTKLGWITGHSYVTYGPLLNGATSIVFEGTPFHPCNDRFWQVWKSWQDTFFMNSPGLIYNRVNICFLISNRWSRNTR